jgi:hypothetical protein
MATPITFNGASYNVPAYGDGGWAQGAGNLSSYLIAIAAGTLQTTGGAFTLSAEVDFGATYSIKGAYFKSRTTLPSTTGVLRLASADSVGWMNNAGGADILLSKDSSDRLKWGSAFIVTSSSGVTPVQYAYTFAAGTASGTYTGSLTLVNLAAAYVANGTNLAVYVNGLLCAVTLDYTETSTTSFTFTSPLNVGDRITARWTIF